MSAAFEVKPPSVYAAFGSKAGVFAAALERYGASMSPAFAGLFTVPDPAQAIHAVLSGAADLYTTWPEMPGCLVLDGARGTEDAEAQQAATCHRAAFRAALNARLRTLEDSMADLRTDATLAAIMGLSAAARAGLGREDLRRIAIAFADGIGRLGQ